MKIGLTALASAAFLLLLPIRAPAQPGAGWVLIESDGTAQTISAEELKVLADNPPPGVKVWHWSPQVPVQRFEDLRTALRPDTAGHETLEILVTAQPEERKPARLIAAPEAMWEEVPENLLPRWEIVWLGQEERGPGRVRIPVDPSEPWRARIVGENFGSSWQRIAAGKPRWTLNPATAKDLQLAVQRVQPEPTVVPVVGARVSLRPGLNRKGRDPEVAFEVSDAQGKLTFPSIPVGQEITLVLEAEGLAPHAITGAAQHLSGIVRLWEGVGLRGRVVDQEGKPMEQVRVEASAWIAPQVPQLLQRQVATDSNGRWRIERMPGGEIVVSATAPGFALARKTIELREGTADLGDLTLTPDPGILVSVTTADSGAPVSGARVRAEGQEFTTDRGGQTTLVGMPVEGTLTLAVEAPGHVEALESIPLPARDEVRIELRQAFTVTGRLVNEAGIPFTQGEARARVRSGSRSQGALSPLQTDGTFRLAVPPRGPGKLILRTPETMDLAVEFVSGEPGESLDLGDLIPTAGVQIIGRILDGKDGSPLPGARIWSPEGTAEHELVSWVNGAVRSVVSDTEGHFRMAGIPPEIPFVLRIDRPGFARAHRTVRPTAKTPEIDLGEIPLLEGTTVEVYIEDDQEGAQASVDLRGKGLELDLLKSPVWDGRAVFEHVPPETVNVAVRRGEIELCDQTVQVPESGTLEVRCRRRGVAVQGLVQVGGLPAGPGTLGWNPATEEQGIAIELRGPGGMSRSRNFLSGNKPFRVPVDASGWFAVEAVKAGQWEIFWQPQEGAGDHQVLTVEIPDVEHHTLTLAYTATLLQGVVVDAQEEPVAGADVFVLQGGNRTSSDIDGAFSLPIAGSGTYLVQARLASAQIYSEAVPIEVRPDEEPPPLTLTLSTEPEELVVHVLGLRGGPAAGALVFADTGNGRYRLSTADSAGRARFRLTPPLPQRVRAAARSEGVWALGSWWTLDEVADGAVLRLAQGGTLSVETDEAGILEILGPEGWDIGSLLARIGLQPRISAGQPVTLSGLPAGLYALSLGTLRAQASVRAEDHSRLRLD